MNYRRWRQIRGWVLAGLLAAALGLGGYGVIQEMQGSALQAEILSAHAAQMDFRLTRGGAAGLPAPKAGPYNERLGYTAIPRLIDQLERNGFITQWQAEPSPALRRWVLDGFFPIYREKNTAGLTLLDRSGALLYQARWPSRGFGSFADIPPLLTQTLRQIENRELLDPRFPMHNPAVEWDRLAQATLGQALSRLGMGDDAGGGSTLATQIEKFRHSPEGRTGGIMDKFRQIASASMRAYQDGPITWQAQQRIVLDYLNNTPLSAAPRWGEVNGIGDGLHVWFGRELSETVALLRQPAHSPAALQAQAAAYKEVLALLLAQRRPTYYLLSNRAALGRLADAELDRLHSAGIISAALHDAARQTPLRFRTSSPEPAASEFLARKAANSIRSRLLTLLGMDSLYRLDRLDATVATTLDRAAQDAVVAVLRQLGDAAGARSLGLFGFRLFQPTDDVAAVRYSVILFERGVAGNYLRVQADNIDGPLDLNDGAKLDLGSTAKLRTLVTYLQIIAELYERLATTPAVGLWLLAQNAPDALTSFVASTLANQEQLRGQRDLPALLELAMQRPYSANPSEGFFTGGGLHHFANFERQDDGKIVPLSEAFRHSINLPFIRLMRDIVQYLQAETLGDRQILLTNPDHPQRQQYLEKFADREGAQFLSRFIADYRPLSPEARLRRAQENAAPQPRAQALLFAILYPGSKAEDFVQYYRARFADRPVSSNGLRAAFANAETNRLPLTEQAFAVGLNPLELWLVSFLQRQPGASRAEILAASTIERQAAYSWLFNTRNIPAQSQRIRQVLEQDAFARLQERWAVLGYPFGRLVPSYATAIGSSADRPGALAQLLGLILHDGRQLPVVRIEHVNLAANTPYQAVLSRSNAEQNPQLLHPAVAARLRVALRDVVANGTARRVGDAFRMTDGSILPVGGKTGTGDHRYEVYDSAGRVIRSEVRSRTASFAFTIGDRFFGSITAYVEGPAAARFRFTSALPAQLLRALAPALQPLLAAPPLKQSDARKEQPAKGAARKEPAEL